MGKFSDEMKKMNPSPDAVKNSSYHMVECRAHGCPLGVMVKTNIDFASCQYHRFTEGDQLQAVTKRIRDNLRWILGYRKMTMWSGDDWSKFENHLKKNEFLPMEEGEPPSIYLNRYFARLDAIIEGKLESAV